jgi:hypothetical protein
MRVVLDYASRSKNDGLATAFCILSWTLVFVGPPAAFFAEAALHTYGLRSLSGPNWQHPSFHDVLATAVAMGPPILGILVALLARRSRRWRAWAVGAIALHAYLLWAFGQMEVVFWQN